MPDIAHPLAGRRVLVVEDEYLIAMEIGRWLAAAGAEIVGPVPSVEQALDLVEDDGLDAAVLDVNLGDGDTVYPLAERLTAARVPYLFATGEMRTVDDPVYNARPRLEKPFLASELIRIVTELVS